MPGDNDRAYILARRVLLDVLEALAEHREAVILVGAQAIYLHTGEGDLATGLYTADGDLVIDPDLPGPVPILEQALEGAGFRHTQASGAIGTWVGYGGVHRRQDDKDALDIYRLLQAVSLDTFVTGIGRLRDEPLSAAIIGEALIHLSEVFGTVEADGCQMAARAVELLDDPETVAASCTALAQDILQAL